MPKVIYFLQGIPVSKGLNVILPKRFIKQNHDISSMQHNNIDSVEPKVHDESDNIWPLFQNEPLEVSVNHTRGYTIIMGVQI